MTESTEPPSRKRNAFGRLRDLRRKKLRSLSARTFLMVTVPTSALIGYAGTQSTPQMQSLPAAVQASYYGQEFAGQPTASGETFDPGDMTAAHRTLPFGSLVEVVDAVTGKSVVVRINDRGPFHGNRDIDLSEAAARQIGMIGNGTAKVGLHVVGRA